VRRTLFLRRLLHLAQGAGEVLRGWLVERILDQQAQVRTQPGT
jgi:hypothetical protein